MAERHEHTRILILDDTADGEIIAELIDCSLKILCEVAHTEAEADRRICMARASGNSFAIIVVDCQLVNREPLMICIRKDRILKHYIPEGTTERDLYDYYLDTGRLDTRINLRLGNIVDDHRSRRDDIKNGIEIAERLLSADESLRIVMKMAPGITDREPGSTEIAAKKLLDSFPQRVFMCFDVSMIIKRIEKLLNLTSRS